MRLIDADELKKLILAERDKIPRKVPSAIYELVAEKDNLHGNAMRGGIRIALRCMENTPTVEAEPVRHGRWKFEFELDKTNFYRCSECDRQEVLLAKENIEEWFPYCHCGAKMDGGAEDV